jgi:hypothetical protein
MMTLHEMQRRLNGFELQQEVQEAIIETSTDMIVLNQGQMSLGLRSDGTEITPTYSDLTIMLKDEKGQESRWVTLKDKGDFWGDMFVDVGNNSYEMGSADAKAAKLEKKYGKKVFGLSKESKSEEYIPIYLLPEIQNRITKKLGFKFG